MRPTHPLSVAALALLLPLARLSAAPPTPAATAAASMAHSHAHDQAAATPEISRPPGPHAVETATIPYAKIGGKEVSGYLAKPRDGKPGGPALMLVFDWWGLNDNLRAMARQFASHGYTTLAIDLYGGQAATEPDQAQQLMKTALSDIPALQDNLEQGVAYLHDKAGARKVGVLGWCFGGGWALQTALLAPDRVDALVMYYGQPELDRAKLDKLRAPLLGNFAGDDKSFDPPTVQKFDALLKELHKDADIKIFPGVAHAFASPNGTSYSKPAADAAWARTMAFLHRHLGGD